MRKPHSRCARMKDGDARARLRRRFSHYRLIGDMRPSASPISIHWRRAKSEQVSDYKTHPRHELMVRITDLITDWGPNDTNTRHAQSPVSPIMKKSETCFILAHHRFNCRLGSLFALIGDTPY
jgi:hypothetical protein